MCDVDEFYDECEELNCQAQFERIVGAGKIWRVEFHYYEQQHADTQLSLSEDLVFVEQIRERVEEHTHRTEQGRNLKWNDKIILLN